MPKIGIANSIASAISQHAIKAITKPTSFWQNTLPKTEQELNLPSKTKTLSGGFNQILFHYTGTSTFKFQANHISLSWSIAWWKKSICDITPQNIKPKENHCWISWVCRILVDWYRDSIRISITTISLTRDLININHCSAFIFSFHLSIARWQGQSTGHPLCRQRSRWVAKRGRRKFSKQPPICPEYYPQTGRTNTDPNVCTQRKISHDSKYGYSGYRYRCNPRGVDFLNQCIR